MTRSLWSWVLLPILAAGLLLAAILIINTTFMLYDDEGYILITYRNFIDGGRLYDEIFSQYGPWPYVYHLIASFGSENAVTHGFGRMLTALHWTLCAVFAGGIAWHATYRLLPAVGAMLLAFGLLVPMSAEPSHPGSLISVTLAAGILTVLIALQARRWAMLGATVGLVTALLMLTKINVGLFFAAGAGAAALRFTDWPGRWQKPADRLALGGLLALPWGLMAGKFGEPWVLAFAALFTFSIAGVVWGTPSMKSGRFFAARAWGAALVAFVVVAFAICAVVMLRGTSVAALVNAVLVAPLRQPAHFQLGLNWPPWIWLVAAVCGLIVGRAGWEIRRRGDVTDLTMGVIHGVRLAALLALSFNLERWLTNEGVVDFMMLCLPLAPVFVIAPGKQASTPDGRALWLLAFLALPQVLHAYPVAGSQKAWGTFLIVPLMAAGWFRTCLAVSFSLPSRRSWIARMGWWVLPAVGCLQLGLLLHTGWERYRTSKPLGLPGAENLRPGGTARIMLRALTFNAALHGEVLFSSPGMFSYNLWSGVPTPTAANATHWFWLLNETAQEKIIARLQASPRRAIIGSPWLDNYLAAAGVPTDSPLHAYLEDQHKLLFTSRGFDFHVPLESKAVPFGFVDVYLSRESMEVEFPVMFQANVALSGRPKQASLQQLHHPWAIRQLYEAPRDRVTLEPITAEGSSLGPEIPLSATNEFQGLFRLRIYTQEAPPPSLSQDLLLVLSSETGATLAEAVFGYDSAPSGHQQETNPEG